MARYRLRFLLQEFDLAKGSTLIGRSSDCQVTIEDPLVSRQHARIDNDGEIATLVDLGSRNGVKVNGKLTREPTQLKDGDRLRVGTQDLVFCVVAGAEKGALAGKTTGFLRYCGRCHLPYPRENGTCSNCGSDEQIEEETLTGKLEGHQLQEGWSVKLIVEVLDRALGLGRVPDAERILRRASTEVEERFVNGQSVDPKQLAAIGAAAIRVALAGGDIAWGAWVAQVYRRVQFVAPFAVVDGLGELALRAPAEMGESFAALAAHTRGLTAARSSVPAPSQTGQGGADPGRTADRETFDEDIRSIARLEQVGASLAELTGSAGAAGTERAHKSPQTQ